MHFGALAFPGFISNSSFVGGSRQWLNCLTWVPAFHVGDADVVSGSWLWHHPALAVLDTLRVNQQRGIKKKKDWLLNCGPQTGHQHLRGSSRSLPPSKYRIGEGHRRCGSQQEAEEEVYEEVSEYQFRNLGEGVVSQKLAE